LLLLAFLVGSDESGSAPSPLAASHEGKVGRAGAAAALAVRLVVR